MRLRIIRELKASDANGASRPGVPIPASARAADDLFYKGLRRMNAHRDGEAFQIFKSLARFKGGSPELLKTAETCRDVLDPDKSPEERAKHLFSFFQPRFIHIKLDNPENSAPDGDELEEDNELGLLRLSKSEL